MTLRRLFLWVYGAVFVLVIALAGVAVLLFLNQERLERSQRNRLHSFFLAEELRQSGQELTRFARAFVATGDPWFEQCFFDILAIRNGEKPRPDRYERIYWDFIAAKRPSPRGYTAPVPLQTLLKEVGITDDEFAKLREAQAKSDALTATERIAMNARKGLFDDGTGHFTRHGPPDRDLAIRLMHDKAYHDAIADIRKPIDDFFGMLDTRTAATMDGFSRQSRIYLWTIMGICGCLVALKLSAFVLVQKRIAAPVSALLQQTGTLVSDAERLAKVAREIASGQLDKPFVVQAKPLSAASHDEIGELSDKHDEMVTRLQETGSAIATITAKLSARGAQLQTAQSDLKNANRELQRSANELEQRVQSRTAELTKANQELQQSEEKYRVVVDTASDVVIGLAEDNQILFANPAAERIFGYLPSELVGHSLTLLMPESMRERHMRGFQRYLSTGERHINWRGIELIGLRKNGEEFPIEVSFGEYVKNGHRIFTGCIRDISERKKAERAVRENQRLLQAVIDNSNAVVFVKDPEGKYLLLNRRFENLFHITAGDSMGKTDFDFFPAEQAAALRAFDKQVMESKTPLEKEETLKVNDEWHTYLSVKSALCDDEGKLYGLCSIATDITALKRAEELQMRRARHAALRAEVHAAFSEPEGELQRILQHSADAVVRHMGAAFARIWILSSRENVLELQASAGLYTHLDGGHSRVPIGQLKIGLIALERKAHLTNDVLNDSRISHPDWARREGMVSFAGYPLMVEGRVLGVLVLFARQPLEKDTLDALEIVADIVAVGIDRKRAEEQIKENEHRLRLLTDTIPGMIWSAAADGAIDYCNRQILSYTGKTLDQLKGEGWTEVIHPDDVKMLTDNWRSAVSEETFFETEFRHRRADGSFRWCLTRGLPLRDETGRVIRWYGFITDLDDWRKAQEALRKAEADLAHVTRVTTMGEMMSSISHEINQPLGSIANYGNAARRFLSAEPKRLEDVDRALAHVVTEAERASAVINRIRALAKKSPPERALLQIEEVIGDVLALAGRELISRQIEVRTQFAVDLPLVLGDRIQLQQVVLNLVMNGADAMSTSTVRNRTLLVKAHRDVQTSPVCILVSVQDLGAGLRPEEMDRIFKAFYSTKPQGMGLGLAISRTIVEAHGGRLWAEANDGPGATFRFTVPAAA